MAIIVRNTGGDPLAMANAIAVNLVAQSTSGAAKGFFHADSTSNALTPDSAFNTPAPPSGEFVTVTAAVDLASGIKLAIALAGALIGGGQTADPPAHFYDAPANSIVKAGAHVLQDSTNTALLGARATFLASAQAQADADTFANAIKTYFNAHLTQSGVHVTNDTTNTISAANATDLASFETLVNSIRTKLNAHIAHANPSYPQVRVIPA